MSEKLAGELMDAANGVGASIKRKEEHPQDGRVEQSLLPLPVLTCRWQWRRAPSLSRRPGTSGSWPTSTRARPRRPSASSSTRAASTRWRGPRGRRDHGLDGPGAGARHHDHVGCNSCRVARLPNQHYRYARARGLHRRGGAEPSRPRWSGCRLRCRGRVRPPFRTLLPPGGSFRVSPDLLHQQDGPDRRRLLRRREVDQGAPRRPRGAHPAPDRREVRVQGHGRPRDRGSDRVYG